MFGYNILTTQMMGYNHTILVQSQLCIIHNPRNNQYIKNVRLQHTNHTNDGL